MDGYRIRRGAREIRVPDVEAIRLALSAGRLREDDEAWVEGDWVPVRTLLAPRKAPAAADPWAAWNDADEVDAEHVVPAVRTDVDELGVEHLTPMAPPVVVKPEAKVAALSHDALEPVDEAPGAGPPGLREAPPPPAAEPAPPPVIAPSPPPVVTPAATPAPAPRVVPELPPFQPPEAPPKTIPFRGGGRASEPVDGPAEVIDFPHSRPVVPTLSPPPRPEPPLVRPGRVLFYVGLGALVLVAAWAWVRLDQSARALAPLTEPKPVVDDDRPGSGHATRDAGSTLAAEKALRATALGEPRPVEAPGDLGDALLIDLQNLKVDVIQVEAPVTRWGGKKGKDPLAAEIHVVVESKGEPERELGAVAIAAGRYKYSYTLDLSAIEVVLRGPGGDRAWTLDQLKAEQFAKGQIGLAEALGV